MAAHLAPAVSGDPLSGVKPELESPLRAAGDVGGKV